MPLHAQLDCLLIADDLTGACDAAAPFAAGGRRAMVLLSEDADAGDCRVLAVTTESRDLAPSGVPAAMRAAAARLAGVTAGVVFQKIDSTLRGHTAVEIASAVQEFGCRAAVVCPAFPAMNRVVNDGYLKVAGAPDFESVHLATRLSCTHIASGELRAALARGQGIVSLDADCDGDLDRIAAEIRLAALELPILWAGSAGLAAALARSMGETAARAPRPPESGPVLFCIGSDHPVTLAQENTLLAGGKTIRMALDSAGETVPAALAQGRHVLLRIPRERVAAQAVRQRIAAAKPAALVLSGGQTASLVCRALGVQSIELCDELMAGIPRGVLRGGEFDGLPVVTKSGGFGNGHALIRIADYFACLNL